MASRRCSFDRRAKKIGRLQTASNYTNYCNNPLEDEGLLCSVLARLPLLTTFQLRGVCKLWNSVLRSRAFMKAWSTTTRRRRWRRGRHNKRHEDEEEEDSWLVMVRKSRYFERELIAFDSALGTWISLGALLTSSCSDAALAALGGPSFPLVANPRPIWSFSFFTDFLAVRSDGGLLCFLCSPDPQPYGIKAPHYCDLGLHHGPKCRPYYLLVLNPLTGSHTILRPPVKHRRKFNSCTAPELGISLQALADDQYRVFLWQHAHGATHLYYLGDLEIYDSRTRSWEAARSCWRDIPAKIGGAKQLEAADLLWFAYGSGLAFAYNAELDEWSRVDGKLPYQRPLCWGPVIVNNVALLKHRGRVLAATVQYDKPFVLAGFAVWELHHPRTNLPPVAAKVAEWRKVARAPRYLWEGFYELDKELSVSMIQANFIFSGNLICMTIAHCWHEAHDAHFYVPLVYDLDRDLWYHLPPYKGHYDAVAVFGMRPSLLALA